jgi:hypothetical protein
MHTVSVFGITTSFICTAGKLSEHQCMPAAACPVPHSQPPHAHLEQVLIVAVTAWPYGAAQVAPGVGANMKAAANQAQRGAALIQDCSCMMGCTHVPGAQAKQQNVQCRPLLLLLLLLLLWWWWWWWW